MHEEHQYAVRAIKAGASGYLTKDSAATQLVVGDPQGRGGRRVHQRRSRRATRAGRDAARRGPAACLAVRPRVPGVPAAGRRRYRCRTSRRELNLSGKTVSTHKARLMEKLGVDQPGGARPLRDQAPPHRRLRRCPTERWRAGVGRTLAHPGGGLTPRFSARLIAAISGGRWVARMLGAAQCGAMGTQSHQQGLHRRGLCRRCASRLVELVGEI